MNQEDGKLLDLVIQRPIGLLEELPPWSFVTSFRDFRASVISRVIFEWSQDPERFFGKGGCLFSILIDGCRHPRGRECEEGIPPILIDRNQLGLLQPGVPQTSFSNSHFEADQAVLFFAEKFRAENRTRYLVFFPFFSSKKTLK